MNPSSVLSTLLLAAALVAGIIALAGLPSTILNLLVYARSTKRHNRDVSHEGRQPDDAAKAVIDEVIALGFARLGETSIDLPGLQDTTTYFYTHPTGTILAEIASLREKGLMQFTSVFGDDSVVETMHKTGDRFETPDFRSLRNDESVTAAYETHRRAVREFQQAHGAPRPIRNMDELLQWEIVYRQRHVKRKLREGLLRAITMRIWWFYAALYFGAMAFMQDPRNEVPGSIFFIIATGGAFLLMGFFAFATRAFGKR